MESVVINGKEYTLAPLRMKHLKQITQLLENPKQGLLNKLESWHPFIEFSIKEGGAPNFKLEELDDLTMDQLLQLWVKIQNVSGIKVGPKGEQKPRELTGVESTAVSAVPSAGVSVQ